MNDLEILFHEHGPYMVHVEGCGKLVLTKNYSNINNKIYNRVFVKSLIFGKYFESRPSKYHLVTNARYLPNIFTNLPRI